VTGSNPGEVDEALIEMLSTLFPDVPVPFPAIGRSGPLATLAGLVRVESNDGVLKTVALVLSEMRRTARR
jgi:hypothetical protein